MRGPAHGAGAASPDISTELETMKAQGTRRAAS